MAPPSAAPFDLAAELPEFDPEGAPGSEGEDEGLLGEEPRLADETPQHSTYKGPATGKPGTLAEAFSALSFPEEFHDAFLNLVGTNENAPPDVVVAVPFGSYREAVANHLVLGEGRAATLFEQGRFYTFFKDLCKLLAPAPSPPAASSSSVPLSLSHHPKSTPQQPIFVTMAEVEDKLLLKDYLDQTLPGNFKLLHDDEIAKLRLRYFSVTGAHPPNDERPSDEQISAMAHRVRDRSGGRVWAPFAEFAVFGPFDGRSTKLRTFTAMVLNREGTWQQRSLRGPNSFAQWEASWKVYEVLLIMLDVSPPGPLKAYFQSIRRLADLYRKDWPTIACLEEEMRAEQWNRIRQEILDGSSPAPSSWDPKAPWSSIIGASRPFFTQGLRTDWWNERITVLERARSHKPGDLPPSSSTLPGALPSFVSMGIIPELAGRGAGSASSSAVVPPPTQMLGLAATRSARTTSHSNRTSHNRRRATQVFRLLPRPTSPVGSAGSRVTSLGIAALAREARVARAAVGKAPRPDGQRAPLRLGAPRRS